MDIKEFMGQVDGFTEAVGERETLKRVFGDLSIPKNFAQDYIKLLHPKKTAVTVTDIFSETASSKTFRLAPLDGYLPPFRAGQYVNWEVTIGNVKTGRALSISSPPHQRGFYELTIRKMEPGFVSQYLIDTVKVGDDFFISGPAGFFYHEPLTDGKDLVFIAGGSGVTPFRSIIREVTERGLDMRIWLIYGTRTTDDVIFGEQLSAVADRHKNIRYELVVSEPDSNYAGTAGFITGDVIKKCVGDVKGKTFYLCGPEMMYRFVQPELIKLGVPGRRIKKESSGPPPDVTKEPGWPTGITADALFSVIVNGEHTIKARAGEPLMIALERAGLVVPNQCRSGECSLCRTKIVRGDTYMPDRVPVREADRWYNYVHSCMAYPISDLEIRY
ncbi:MAG: 2Fe-2S iron-sulfur cluster binding domain-containing protein [Deltaproteobacteria bacterium]|nr:2Fe-2S iron-sulfur cluster binding domain-containing protein [Candidatus Zymogenaceae bacterium]